MQLLRGSFVGVQCLSIPFVLIAAVFAGGLGLGVGLRPTDAQSGDEFRGCVNNYTGALRILHGNAQCTPAERPLNWSQQGLSGLLGIQVVRATTSVNTEEEPSHGIEYVQAFCPAGYRVIGGGAGGVGYFKGSDSWYVNYSAPRLADEYGSQGVDSWISSYKINDDDYPVDGEYSFESVAICALTSN